MVRFYLTPVEVVVSGGTAYRLPQHFRSRPDLDPLRASPRVSVGASVMYYGEERVCIAESDVTPAEHATLAAQAEVIAFPADLDEVVPARMAADLTARNIDSGWMDGATTCRDVVRSIKRMFCVAQRLRGRIAARDGNTRAASMFSGGVTLETRLRDMPVAHRTEMLAALDDLGFDRSSLSGASTCRELLRVCRTQTPVSLRRIDDARVRVRT